MICPPPPPATHATMKTAQPRNHTTFKRTDYSEKSVVMNYVMLIGDN
jgi:hypothetical protein